MVTWELISSTGIITTLPTLSPFKCIRHPYAHHRGHTYMYDKEEYPTNKGSPYII